jgi:NAD(P)-dependent dehydrogenase (short-subunit alcohol dehydrogenase family)
MKDGRTVATISADVADEASCKAAAEELAKQFGRVHMLILSAGISEPGELVRTDEATWDRVFAVNVRGCRTALLTTLPLLIAAGQEDKAGSRVCFVSSGAGLTGLYGLSHYCASKFALFGLAQSMQQELLTSGVRVCVHFPPDTDTPLLAAENLRKPQLTKELSETIAVLQPEDVARTLVHDCARGAFLSAHDFISWLLLVQTAGMSPTPTVGEFVSQFLLAGFPLKLVALITLTDWFGTIRKQHNALVKPVLMGTAAASHLSVLARRAGHAFPSAMESDIAEASAWSAADAGSASSSDVAVDGAVADEEAEADADDDDDAPASGVRQRASSNTRAPKA